MENTGQPSKKDQLQFDFAAGGSDQGYTSWQEARRVHMQTLARNLGLPLGRQAEVRLRDGVVLRGLLCLREENLWVDRERDIHLELMIQRTSFTAAEIEACVRLD